jgi:quinol monooxygenase YgiN
MVYTLTVHLRGTYPVQPVNSSPLTNQANSSEVVPKLKAKLLEASSIYSKDKETLSWFVMQSVHDPRDFTIIERYLNEGSQKYHLENPYWKTFDPAVLPMLEEIKGGNVNDGKMDLRRNEELVE